ncbi:MAG: HAD family phosphatase [Elusimicrobia bacterium]|nr:HAD family phosphatase [Elusimicrobiota bacterium]MBU2615429.1 HAD family phosphatase [Elusimicrobiota bacterium]
MKKLIKKPKAVLFDMDGVIIDSMPYHFIAWFETLKPLGVKINSFDIYSREGEHWKKTISDLLKRSKLKYSKKKIEEMLPVKQRIFKKLFKRFIFKGAEEILEHFKKNGYLLGLVTGSYANNIKNVLPKTLYQMFDTIISAESTKNGKPYPEPYLTAAKMLSLKPKDCVVVENSTLGVLSAKNAGMFCIAITSSLPKEYLRKANITVDDLLEIKKIIR